MVNLFLTRVPKQFNGEKNNLSKKWFWGTVNSHAKE